MDLVGILTVDQSDIGLKFMLYHLGSTEYLEVKAMDFVAKHKTGEQCCPVTALIINYDPGMTLTNIVPMFLCLINCLSTVCLPFSKIFSNQVLRTCFSLLKGF